MRRGVFSVTVVGVLFFIMLGMQGRAFAVGHGGMFTKIWQPVVRGATVYLRSTGNGLMHKTLTLVMLGLTFCGTMSCSRDDLSDDDALLNEAVQLSEVAPLSEREVMLQSGWHYYTWKHIYFLVNGSGEIDLGYVLGHERKSDTLVNLFLVQLTDKSELVVHKAQIGGEMLVGNPDVGAPVELVGERTDERLTGIITAAYGDYETEQLWEGTELTNQVVELYVVRLDSGEEAIVPKGSILTWLGGIELW